MLEAMLLAFGFDSFHLGFEYFSIEFELSQAIAIKIPVDKVPIQWVSRFMGFLLPVWNIPLDEFEPNLTIMATDLRRCYFNLSLDAVINTSLT